MAFFSQKMGQFTYFSQQVGDSHWGGKDVLDFGGNVGNILRDPNSTIDPARYWCVDVVRDSIERGRQAYPQAHWVFYDRYCFFFNPLGEPRLPLPPLGRTFDYIVAYSVFTNTSRTDMLQQVADLEALLNERGVLAFTFIDPNYFSWPGRYEGNNFRWRLEREQFLESEKGNVLEIEPEEMLKRAAGADWFILVNGEDLYLETEEIKPYEPERQRTCHVFYTESYMRNLFPHAAVLPPVNDEMQHCCVIRRAA
ncbi:MAG TPA: class I SAM-dependent methyltransferase [Pyrinomonadaceae bacterium]|nr:class I SAM-dependent methyltransferase [Pyrinomonadaceae bacterium]